MLRKIKYYLQIIPLIKYVQNWYDIILIYFFSNRQFVLNLRDGTNFKISHYLDALTVKEIFVENDYHINLKNPKTIIDIGANIGAFSILQSKKYPGAKIFSFEPSKKTFTLIKYNTKINNCSNINLYNFGIWKKRIKTFFYSNKASGLSSLFKKAGREGAHRETVKMDTLAKVFLKNKIKSCDLVKMDCEGAEYEIILNLPPWLLAKVKNFAIEYHDSLTEHTHIELVEFLTKTGFKIKSKKHPLENNIGIIYAKR